MKYDFSGYATKNNLKCADGRTIMQNAFKGNDGQTVPLVWQHLHNDPGNVLGHALLENRDDGVYAYCKFNDTPAGINAKELVKHGDITFLSIFANNLVQKGLNVIHGAIREVSLVLSGANPGALIDNLSITHTDGTNEDSEEEAIIYTGLVVSVEEEPLEHSGGANQNGSKTVQEVFDSLTDEQKNVVYAMLAQVASTTAHSGIHDNNMYGQFGEGGLDMKTNVFDQSGAEEKTLSHSQIQTIFEDAVSFGSLRESFFAHAEELGYGIEDIDILFPDAKLVTPKPEVIGRRMEWVGGVLNGARHSPFSRIKSTAVDITADEARAKGYITGKKKTEEVIKLLKRVTTPTTIYKKQKLDRDDIIDITDLDVVAWLKAEMRMMLDEEIARAILIGDGRDITSDDKIDEDHIRPIVSDDELYSHPVTVPANVSGSGLIEAILRARNHYKGSGSPSFYTTDEVLTDLLLLKDRLGRRLYRTEEELATAIRVKSIITVEPMETIANLLGIMVNIHDYTIGADKGGKVSLFDDFDIDYNQYKYLLETRISGTLTKPKSALVFFRGEGIKVTPDTPTFVAETGIVTIPEKEGVIYRSEGQLLEAGPQPEIEAGSSMVVTAEPDEGYYFPHNITTDWEFVRSEL